MKMTTIHLHKEKINTFQKKDRQSHENTLQTNHKENAHDKFAKEEEETFFKRSNGKKRFPGRLPRPLRKRRNGRREAISVVVFAGFLNSETI